MRRALTSLHSSMNSRRAAACASLTERVGMRDASVTSPPSSASLSVYAAASLSHSLGSASTAERRRSRCAQSFSWEV